MKIALIIVIAYIIILGDFYASHNNSKREYRFEYNGLLWVGLDYWSIKKYKSSDMPMKIFSFKREDIKKKHLKIKS